mmetsp:Transcript_32153/g.50183  ORF Transcript_32153/g.50183 Transcript_32153/m.50183 type:complete len:109 (+) Transcript_32153:227-553(+)|eukprot:CAMPEP_0184300586 /NCGR_PEP_ID=MMETSP1049-20130417/10970_1 /TAXON_ID=77928 /ORGANISM="Proteomonas sulcata, Strain CCMP704" /LENGTH=108 /DNA_ID=CAMNT_0026611347 /DNA_START=210 /DNA_END=536 /DNA_ORIENTATION=+
MIQLDPPEEEEAVPKSPLTPRGSTPLTPRGSTPLTPRLAKSLPVSGPSSPELESRGRRGSKRGSFSAQGQGAKRGNQSDIKSMLSAFEAALAKVQVQMENQMETNRAR